MTKAKSQHAWPPTKAPKTKPAVPSQVTIPTAILSRCACESAVEELFNRLECDYMEMTDEVFNATLKAVSDLRLTEKDSK